VVKSKILVFVIGFFVFLFVSNTHINACTSLLVTKGASKDGSVMITYTCDGEFHPHLEYIPAADYEPGDSLEITDWFGNVRGKVEQVEHTYAVVGLMNEHQLVIGETTFEGRKELQNPGGLLHYWDLMRLALQRAKTAREAVEVITSLVEDYGYASSGESFSIADQKEAWILEMIGPDSGSLGAEWVAVKVPNGYISCHANKARIGEFPLNDPRNCLYSEDVISFAIEKGYYDPESGEPFRYCDAYCPATMKNKRYCDGRVWSIFRRAAPSRDFSPDYYRGVEEARPYPLWIKPDKKLSVADVFGLMRDHFEGTEYDMTKGIDAGPHGLPYRWRPVTWVVDSIEYGWERAISTQQTAFSFVSQSRSHLPDPIGGVFWCGEDDTYVTCYVPMYCGINDVPKSFATGSRDKFSWDSAWWVFNLVSNYAYLRWCYTIEDIQSVQRELETNLLRLQPEIEKTALRLYKNERDLMTQFLTDYSLAQAEKVVARWQELAEYLIVKYNDGYVKEEDEPPQWKGYPEAWLREVKGARPDQFYLGKQESDKEE
jgi:dipeptidase